VWVGVAMWWVTAFEPAWFGFARSRWSCEAVAVALRDDYRVRVSPTPGLPPANSRTTARPTPADPPGDDHHF
jgi:hypothetical protein